MGTRFLTLSLLLSTLALGASLAYGADNPVPPPPIPDSSDLTAPPPPAPPVPSEAVSPTPSSPSSVPPPPLPEPTATLQPPPPVPPDVSNNSPSAVPPPPLPDNSASVPAPAPPPPPKVSNAHSSTPVSTPQATAPAPPEAQAPPAAPPVPSAPTPAADALGQALSLFKQKMYQEAIPLFKQALAQKPGDAKLYYYLGSCQYKAGRLREAVVNLSISYRLRIDMKLEDFVHRLRATLTSQEIEWVDAQVAAYGTGKTPDVPEPIDYPQFGVSLEPNMSFINLVEFKNDAESGINYAANNQASDPGYQFSASIPNAFVGFTLEPFLRLDSHLEIGLPLSFFPVGTVSESAIDPLNGNSSISFALSALSGGLDFKLLAGDRPFQFFASIGPRLASVSVGLNYTGPAGPATGNFNSTAFGAEAKVGLDWEIANNFLLSPAIGYRLLQAGTLNGNVTYLGTTQRERLEYDTNSTNTPITYVPANSPDPAGMTPFNLDLSGPTCSLTLTALF